MKHYDLIVAGGGFSGVMAACAAGRDGLSVLLLEKSGALGGAACINYVLPFMNFMYTNKKNGERRPLSKGLFQEFLKRMEAYGALDGDVCVTFNEEYLKVVMDDMTDAYGVDVLFHSTLIGAETEDTEKGSPEDPGKILKSVRFLNVNGIMEATADRFIDATGDGTLFQMAGCGYHVGRETDGKTQPMTLCFRMGNVDMARFNREDRAKVNAIWKEKLAAGELLNPREDILTFSHMTPDVLHLNSTRVLGDPTDPEVRSKAEKTARKEMVELYEFLKKYAPSCKDATILSSSYEIGVRESRMVDGLYQINTADILECRKFEDAMTAGNYDIDIHSPDGSGTTHYWIPDGDFYTIPYRACVPKDISNLLVAGRCISSTHEAQAAYRIMPIVACIGEGAGIMAAFAKQNGLKNYEVTAADVKQCMDARDLVEKMDI